MDYIKSIRPKLGHQKILLNSAGAVVVRDGGLLLQRRSDNGRWGLPGGLMELGESFEETARREVYEETGLTPGPLRFLGVWSGKEFLCRAANGDEFFSVTAAYMAREWTGALAEPDGLYSCAAKDLSAEVSVPGEKIVAEVPVVTPLPTAQRTASV